MYSSSKLTPRRSLRISCKNIAQNFNLPTNEIHSSGCLTTAASGNIKHKIKQLATVLKSSISRASEKKFIKNDISLIIGIDEAGRGPLAGPVVAAACIVDNAVQIDGIMDSKATTENDRERIYEELVVNPLVKWAVCRVEHVEIDEVNILEASLLAMRRAVDSLISRYSIKPGECIALVDGNKIPREMPVHSECIIKGDGSIFSIAAASIIAKVTRDRIMVAYSQQYPQYGLERHKGYPTAAHVAALHQHGPCPIHRLTFAPVRISIRTVTTLIPDIKKKHVRRKRPLETLQEAPTYKRNKKLLK